MLAYPRKDALCAALDFIEARWWHNICVGQVNVRGDEVVQLLRLLDIVVARGKTRHLQRHLRRWAYLRQVYLRCVSAKHNIPF